MLWLYLLGGFQVLGFVVTLIRLAYDEWQQSRASRTTPAAEETSPRSGVYNMEIQDNVISIAQHAASLNRPFWKFRYPHQVATDTTMSLEDKRAILAAWASDEHALESLPTLRHLPGTPFPVTFSSIMRARIALDKMSEDNDDDPPPPLIPAVSRRPALNPAA